MSASSSIVGKPSPATATQAGAEDPSGNLQPLQVTADGELIIAGTFTSTIDFSGTPGAAVPAKAGYMAGTDGTNLRGLKTDTNGELQVDVLSSALPSGAATETTLSALNGKVTACNTGAVVVSSSALPSGAATESTLSALNGKVTACNTGAVVVSSSALPSGAATESTLSTLNGKVTACNTGAVVISSGTVTSITNALPAGTNLVGFVSTAGQSGDTNALSSAASTALETSRVIKASAGRLYQLTGVNTKASAQYIQVYNTTSVPADTAVPVLLAYVPPGANFSFDFGSIGRYFSTGICVSNSSTAATKTIGSADCWFNAEYL